VFVRLTNALVDRLKNWVGERYNKKKSSSKTFMRGEEFTIYGPDGDVLKTWRIDDSESTRTTRQGCGGLVRIGGTPGRSVED